MSRPAQNPTRSGSVDSEQKGDAPKRRLHFLGDSVPFDASVVAALFVVGVSILWTYWPSFVVMSRKWANDPQYSHGYLVPVFAIVLLYLRRSQLKTDTFSPSWWGVPVLLAGLATKFLAAHYYREWFDFLSLLPVIFGCCLLLGGWAAIRWAWTAILFLFFMIPLPHTLELAMRGPLRGIGTQVSTYFMQTLGLPAFAEGNVIVVDNFHIGVVEACSGLRMLMIFFALSTAVAVLMERPLWERAVVLLSAVPIAIFSNVMRITITAVLHVTLAESTLFGMSGTEFADKLFHDWAGWMMMPLALALLWLEMWFLSHIVIAEEQYPMSAGLAGSHD
ncbi:MAG: exosortase/archaeosortase family protein [Planctomycetes bacterium]|nr:exosortase/archaeosortase family protein [Planctomycetota bacterium]